MRFFRLCLFSVLIIFSINLTLPAISAGQMVGGQSTVVVKKGIFDKFIDASTYVVDQMARFAGKVREFIIGKREREKDEKGRTERQIDLTREIVREVNVKVNTPTVELRSEATQVPAEARPVETQIAIVPRDAFNLGKIDGAPAETPAVVVDSRIAVEEKREEPRVEIGRKSEIIEEKVSQVPQQLSKEQIARVGKATPQRIVTNSGATSSPERAESSERAESEIVAGPRRIEAGTVATTTRLEERTTTLRQDPEVEKGCDDGRDERDEFEYEITGDLNNIKVVDNEYLLLLTLEGRDRKTFAVSLCSGNSVECLGETEGVCSNEIDIIEDVAREEVEFRRRIGERLMFVYEDKLYVTKDRSALVASLAAENLVRERLVKINAEAIGVDDDAASTCSRCTIRLSIKDGNGNDVTGLLRDGHILGPPLRYRGVQLADEREEGAVRLFIGMTASDPETDVEASVEKVIVVKYSR